MAYGYMGKILVVDLTTGEINEETIPDEIYEKYTSGVGLASWLLYHRIPAGADPLGPDNIIGIVTGLLTGTGALFTGRWAAVGKSPLTGGWGDANGGGKLAPALKRTGYDGIFFKGKSEKPVYLKVIDGKAELVDASTVWGKDVVESDELIKKELGEKVQTALIGPAGEKQSLISGIVNDKARIAARSGLGAVMGSKNLKGIAVAGKQKADVKDPERVKQVSQKFMKWFKKDDRLKRKIITNTLLAWSAKLMRRTPIMPQFPGDILKIALDKWGTMGGSVMSSECGDSPVKNWKGAGYKDFPMSTHSNNLNPDKIIAYQKKKYHCTSCPLGCGGELEVNDGPYNLGETHKPEYEAMASLGTLLLNRDLHSILKMNDMLNRAGMDCIGAAVTVAWAMECYEQGVLTKDDLDGIDLVWGNTDGIIMLIDKMIKREGIGGILADGCKSASERLNKGKEFAMHAGGQELPAHDGRFDPGFALAYAVEPTPGKHTNHGYTWLELFVLPKIIKSLPPLPAYTTVKNKYEVDIARIKQLVAASQYMQFVNGIGACFFGAQMNGELDLPAYVNAVTGWNKTPEDYLKIGERIQNLRQAFNIKQGIKPKTDFTLPDRAWGKPPLEYGPMKGVTLKLKSLQNAFLDSIGWDRETAVPTKAKLLELGLEDVALELEDRYSIGAGEKDKS